ncbi:MAG: FecR family protein [Bacteroidia bacterium]|nr:FecR family protein [Bacteroidia bacterium]
MEDEKYLELMTKYLSGNISDAENYLLKEWLAADKNNTIMFEELKKIWMLSGKYESDFEPDVKSAVERFQTRIATSDNLKPNPFKNIVKIAAVILLLAVVAIVIKLTVTKDNTAKTKLTSSLESKAEYQLPDSSRVWLNKNTTLTYSSDFDDRVVNLDGEAYFEVKKSNGKPFTIYCGKIKTVVLGTSFTIKSDAQFKNIEVIVLTGKVALSDKSGNEKHKAILTPGEKGAYNSNNNTISISKNEDLNFLSWKTNVLTFRNTPMDQVLSALIKYYGKQIVVENNSIDNCTLTSTFDNQGLNDVLEELQILLNIEFKIENNKVVISKGGC